MQQGRSPAQPCKPLARRSGEGGTSDRNRALHHLLRAWVSTGPSKQQSCIFPGKPQLLLPELPWSQRRGSSPAWQRRGRIPAGLWAKEAPTARHRDQTWVGTPACSAMTQQGEAQLLSAVMHKRLKAQPRQARVWPAASLSQDFEGAGSSPSLQGLHCHIPQTCLLSPSSWDGTEQGSLTKACLAARMGSKSRVKCSSSPGAGQGQARDCPGTHRQHCQVPLAVPGSCCSEGWKAGSTEQPHPPSYFVKHPNSFSQAKGDLCSALGQFLL